jgi:hypothetical protein
MSCACFDKDRMLALNGGNGIGPRRHRPPSRHFEASTVIA